MRTHDALFFVTDNPMLWVDSGGVVLRGNAAFYQFSGLTEEAITARKIFDICGLQWDKLLADQAEPGTSPTSITFNTTSYPTRIALLQAPDTSHTESTFWVTLLLEPPIEISSKVVASEKALHSLFNNSFDAIAFFSNNGSCQQANRTFFELLGYPDRKTSHIHINQLVPKGTELLNQEMEEQLSARGSTDVFERDIVHTDGARIAVNVRATTVVDGNNETQGTWIILRDISKNQSQLRTLKHQQQLLELTGRLAGVGGWEYVEKSRYVSFTPEACKLLGVSALASHKLSDMLKLFIADSSYEIQASVEVAFLLKTPFDIEVEYIGFKHARTMRLSGRVKKDGDTQYLVGAIQDISQYKNKAADKVPAQSEPAIGAFGSSYQDKLTGLHNKIFLISQLKSLMTQSFKHPLIFIEIDLRNFRRINENAGYSAGDECLVQTSRRLQAHLQSQDLLARIGGDEFGVVLINQPVDQAVHLANTLMDAIEQPIMIDGRKFQVQAAACIVVANTDSDSADILRAANEGIAVIQTRETRYYVVNLNSDLAP